MSLKNRFLADVTFFYKALNGISNINIDSYVDFFLMLIIIHSRKMMIYLLRRNMQEQTHSNNYRIFNRIVDSWNLLPYDTRRAVSVNL